MEAVLLASSDLPFVRLTGSKREQRNGGTCQPSWLLLTVCLIDAPKQMAANKTR